MNVEWSIYSINTCSKPLLQLRRGPAAVIKAIDRSVYSCLFGRGSSGECYSEREETQDRDAGNKGKLQRPRAPNSDKKIKEDLSCNTRLGFPHSRSW